MEALRLCLARHGETDWNAAGRIQGQLDIPLNARGQRQAAALAAALAGQSFDAVYSSDLGRAQQTARVLAAAHGLAVHTLADWRERHHGRMQGNTYDELKLSWPHGYQRLRARDPEFDVAGGESLQGLALRVAGALERLRARHAHGTVALVTHGGTLDAVYRLVSGQPLHEPRRVPIRNCSIHWLRHDGERWSIVAWGGDGHLVEARDELPG
jgi:probable phosphoglycerate mutase